MDTAQWPVQEIGLMKPMEEIIVPNHNNNACSSRVPTAAAATTTTTSHMLDQKIRATRPQKEQHALNCPRCNSTNTKFCYYNNYSLTQPRYFCKTCRRYWTEGGSLRNVPVGGGSRKNKRSSSSSTTTTPSTTTTTMATTMTTTSKSSYHDENPNKVMINNEGHDLNLGFPLSQDYHHHHHHHHHQRVVHEFVDQLPNIDHHQNNNNNNNSSSCSTANTTTTPSSISALDLLRSRGIASRGLMSSLMMPMPMPSVIPDININNTVYSSSSLSSSSPQLGFALQDFKPTLNFGVDGLGLGGSYGGLVQGVNQASGTNNGRLLFPFEELKPSTINANSTTTTTTTTTTEAAAATNSDDQYENHISNRGVQGESTNGYWSGMLGGHGSW
ncbi:hypothetical protein Scep_025371 [Stephania cephalantha]|uniref:Dof zinc finger protein n=1 Tax=Stephania cephalantha TaxID=152367 RepID=A0AAP0ENC9_9MAGN